MRATGIQIELTGMRARLQSVHRKWDVVAHWVGAVAVAGLGYSLTVTEVAGNAGSLFAFGLSLHPRALRIPNAYDRLKNAIRGNARRTALAEDRVESECRRLLASTGLTV